VDVDVVADGDVSDSACDHVYVYVIDDANVRGR
jgi:hypothetical protein